MRIGIARTEQYHCSSERPVMMKFEIGWPYQASGECD